MTEPMAGTALPRRWGRAWAAVLVVLAVAVAGTSIGLTSGTRPPIAWDHRLAPLAAFVEKERGLRFERGVPIEYLDDAHFRRFVAGGDVQPDRVQEKASAATLRAFGLLPPGVTLAKIVGKVTGETVLGLYDPLSRRIVVRGTDFSDDLRSTLVHELTHALQDQRFGLDRTPHPSGAAAAWQATVEGDARRVQTAWEDGLSDRRRRALDQAQRRAQGKADVGDVPPVFLEISESPYLVGPPFIEDIVAAGGEKAHNRLFTHPATTEEHILLPATYLAGQRAEHLPAPTLGAGERRIRGSASDIGMLSLLVVLAERIDYDQAWQAVQHWAGDTSVAFRRGDATCVRGAVAFDDAASATRFQGAFTAWATGVPASATSDGRRVNLQTCDPGRDAPRRAPGHVSGVMGLAIRDGLATQIFDSGASWKQARCADGLIAQIGTQRIADLDTVARRNPRDPQVAAIQRIARQQSRRCGL